MSKIDDYLDDADKVDPLNAEDVTWLKNRIAELRHVPNGVIEKMYREYSNMFAAGWLILDENTIQSFKSWLR